MIAGKGGVYAGFARMISRIYSRSKKEFCQVRKDSLVLGIGGYAPWCEAFCDCKERRGAKEGSGQELYNSNCREGVGL